MYVNETLHIPAITRKDISMAFLPDLAGSKLAVEILTRKTEIFQRLVVADFLALLYSSSKYWRTDQIRYNEAVGVINVSTPLFDSVLASQHLNKRTLVKAGVLFSMMPVSEREEPGAGELVSRRLWYKISAQKLFENILYFDVKDGRYIPDIGVDKFSASSNIKGALSVYKQIDAENAHTRLQMYVSDANIPSSLLSTVTTAKGEIDMNATTAQETEAVTAAATATIEGVVGYRTGIRKGKDGVTVNTSDYFFFSDQRGRFGMHEIYSFLAGRERADDVRRIRISIVATDGKYVDVRACERDGYMVAETSFSTSNFDAVGFIPGPRVINDVIERAPCVAHLLTDETGPLLRIEVPAGLGIKFKKGASTGKPTIIRENIKRRVATSQPVEQSEVVAEEPVAEAAVVTPAMEPSASPVMALVEKEDVFIRDKNGVLWIVDSNDLTKVREASRIEAAFFEMLRVDQA